MKKQNLPLAIFAICAAGTTASTHVDVGECQNAKDGIGTHDHAIEFCGAFSSGTISDFEIAINGNLYVIPNTVDNLPGRFTSIEYHEDEKASEFTRFSPSGFTSAGILGSVAFAGDTLIYASWISPPNPSLSTVAFQLYDYDPATAVLTEGVFVTMPTNTDRNSVLTPAISAEPEQFAIFGGVGEDGHSRVNIYRYSDASSEWELEESIDSIPATSVTSLALEGDTLAIGYGSRDEVDLYTRDQMTGWQYEQTLNPFNDSQIKFSNSFGERVRMHGNLIAVGASFTSVYTNNPQYPHSPAGAVYIYDYTDNTVTPLGVIIELDGSPDGMGTGFGASLDISDDGSQLVIGADAYDVCPQEYEFPGAVFVYQTNDFTAPVFTAPSQMYFVPNYASSPGADRYGVAARFSGRTLSVFISKYTSISTDSQNCSLGTPAILIYTQPCSAADFNSDGILSFFDISAFLEAFNASDMATDLNDDGLLNFFDITLFLQIFADGCP